MRVGPIVVGVDGSPESLQALRKTSEIVGKDRASGGLDLVVVHVRHTGWPSGAVAGAQAEVLKALDEIQADTEREVKDILHPLTLTWRFVVREGDPATELVKEADEEKASGIAVGGHRHSTIGAVLTHSVESSLIHAYEGTLFIVREKDATPVL